MVRREGGDHQKEGRCAIQKVQSRILGTDATAGRRQRAQAPVSECCDEVCTATLPRERAREMSSGRLDMKRILPFRCCPPRSGVLSDNLPAFPMPTLEERLPSESLMLIDISNTPSPCKGPTCTGDAGQGLEGGSRPTQQPWVCRASSICAM